MKEEINKLRRHCEKQIRLGKTFDDVKHSEEHKTVLNLINENENLHSQLKAKEEMVEIMERYFEIIIDLAFDYDGAKKADSLKSLIDELVRFAKLGRACNTTETIYSDGKKYYNILNEELKDSDD